MARVSFPLTSIDAKIDARFGLRVPFERAIAESIARGQTLLDIHLEYLEGFRQMIKQILFLHTCRQAII